MEKRLSNFGFKLMSFGYKFRDSRLPRIHILEEVVIQPGFHVLDYGCGPGGYVAATAQLVSESGKVYALDIHPLAIKKVQSIVARNKLTNVETILSDCATGLPDKSIDVALLYDIFHGLTKPDDVLAELHRVLKTDGILSFNDHHMKDEAELLARITNKGLFTLLKKGERVYNFRKNH